jgi:outer membrane biosynthesis protein TonB
VRSQTSAAPAYPLELLTSHVEGNVIARYVVDTTGFADVESLEVVTSTNVGFVRAVRDALPYMRFSPAKIGPMKVKQLVEQSFTFRITPPAKDGQKP